MHDNRELVEERLERLQERVAAHIHRRVAPLAVTAWRAPGEPVDFGVAREESYEDFPAGTWWGPAWSTWWLKVEGRVPADAADLPLELRVDLGFVGDWAGNQSEAMAFTEHGRPLKAVNPMNRTVALNFGALAYTFNASDTPLLRADGSLSLYLEAGCNPNMSHMLNQVTQQGDTLTRSEEPLWQFGGADLVTRNDDVWGLSCDLEVLDGLMRQLPENSTHRATLLRAMEDAADVVDSGDIPLTAAEARQILAPLLVSGANSSAQKMTAVGHAHIDSAWLWPIRETRRKILRTFSNVTALADEYPDFHFAATSAQHYQWLKEASPEVFDRVRAAIARGQWHVVGGMWVESDTNLPGGEALVRQFTSGLRWMRDELGIRPDCLWLPDSFGYTAALPQIARLAGMEWFFTQKLSWNRTNTLPHHTFWWEGLDGTRIWTHFPPVDCYDSIVSPEEVMKAERNFKEKGRAQHSLLPFGYGDGGGGPTALMMERTRRLANLEDAPVVTSAPPSTFFEAARQEYPDAPTWAGELYLEFHRGVYTTQVELKQGNRRSEHALHAIELLASMAGHSSPDYRYPSEALEVLWQRMLLLQFHDILPGSSTSWVNREAAEEYTALAREFQLLLENAWDAVRTDDAGTSVMNAAPIRRREVVESKAGMQFVEVAPHAVTSLEDARVKPLHPVVRRIVDGVNVLDNGLVRVEIDADGCVSGLRDLVAERDVLLPGTRANVLRLHPDHPSCFDAWELESHYRRQGTDLVDATRIDVVADSPLRTRVDVAREFGSSRVVQSISLDADSATVDFELWIDWQERNHVLKVGFPLAVRATRSAAEIQFGHIERPVASNTSWDEARFETSGHRWLLLAEPGYGVALANDSSHGHDVFPAGGSSTSPTSGVTAGLTLLRAPQSPDPLADQGEHTMRYSLTVGADVAAAHHAGLRINQPLRLMPGTAKRTSFTELTPVGAVDLAVVDAVKQAFDGSGDLIVRLHEAAGASSRVDLRLGVDTASVTEVDLLEDDVDQPTQTLPENAVPAGSPVRLTLRPFQILTLRYRSHP
ncbi:alpha-mannosidase [Tessaracoccus antarcticus]|uniref:Alpha-mannosidase n=1 Tax=Tessaracoccus antarcticus TaxID=2479848 RepID=A0A3M0GE68_9ACTN|nr:glycoside hydrolase family 38 C-terminal domain-containing protein [Tessaracoccus antarcticus]RMB59893.1 alpha-mannosidase [Tessaracoccus antarcticus]